MSLQRDKRIIVDEEPDLYDLKLARSEISKTHIPKTLITITLLHDENMAGIDDFARPSLDQVSGNRRARQRWTWSFEISTAKNQIPPPETIIINVLLVAPITPGPTTQFFVDASSNTSKPSKRRDSLDLLAISSLSSIDVFSYDEESKIAIERMETAVTSPPRPGDFISNRNQREDALGWDREENDDLMY